MTYIDAPPGGIPGNFAPVAVPRFNPCSTETGRRIQNDLLDLLSAGKIRPSVGGRYSFDSLPAALDQLESRTTMGRIVIER